MGNRKEERRTFEMLEYYITKLKSSYNDLANLGEKNDVLEAAINAFIDKIYRKNIAKICNINESFITDDILKYIQYGTKYEKMMPDGKYVMSYRPYSNDEVIAIVIGYVRNNAFYDYVNNGYQESNVLNYSEKSIENFDNNTQKNDEKETNNIETNTSIQENEDNNFDPSFIDSLEMNPEELISMDDEMPKEDNIKVSSDSKNKTNKIEEVQKKCAELYDKYYMSSDKSQEALNKIVEEENNLYKQALSELTGINASDIKEFVVKYIKGGIIDTSVDEQNETVKKVRPLTDEEAILIVNNINNMTEEQVKQFIKNE